MENKDSNSLPNYEYHLTEANQGTLIFSASHGSMEPFSQEHLKKEGIPTVKPEVLQKKLKKKKTMNFPYLGMSQIIPYPPKVPNDHMNFWSEMREKLENNLPRENKGEGGLDSDTEMIEKFKIGRNKEQKYGSRRTIF